MVVVKMIELVCFHFVTTIRSCHSFSGMEFSQYGHMCSAYQEKEKGYETMKVNDKAKEKREKNRNLIHKKRRASLPFRCSVEVINNITTINVIAITGIVSFTWNPHRKI